MSFAWTPTVDNVKAAVPAGGAANMERVAPKLRELGTGVCTIRFAVVGAPLTLISWLGTVAVIWVAEMKVEVSGVKSNSTVSPRAKFVPVDGHREARSSRTTLAGLTPIAAG